jgi:biopolymer transport protein ExbB/TolQ
VAFNYFSNKAMELRAEMDTFRADFLAIVERQVIKKSMVSKES